MRKASRRPARERRCVLGAISYQLISALSLGNIALVAASGERVAKVNAEKLSKK